MSPFGSRSNSIDSDNQESMNQQKTSKTQLIIRRRREKSIQSKDSNISSSPSPEKFLIKLQIKSYGSSG
jgi:hypothetical protein